MASRSTSVNNLEIMPKDYLGDSVYAEFDGNGVTLTTNNGYLDDPRNTIYLEPEVYRALLQFVERQKSNTNTEQK